MSDFDKLQAELIHALSLLTIQEIEQVRESWILYINQWEGDNQRVINYCDMMTDLVIRKKREKADAAVYFTNGKEVIL